MTPDPIAQAIATIRGRLTDDALIKVYRAGIGTILFDADGEQAREALRSGITELLAPLFVGAERAREAAIKLALEATNGWACYAKRDMEHREIARLHGEINELRTR